MLNLVTSSPQLNLVTFGNTQRLNVAYVTSPCSCPSKGTATGDYYPNNNPSGFLNTLSGLSVDYVTGISGYLQSLIIAPLTGVLSLNFLSGALELVGIGGISVITSGQTIVLSGFSGSVSNLSGYITTGYADSRYYPLNTNPNGYITGFDSGLYLLKTETGQFQSSGNYVTGIVARPSDLLDYYLTSNPSGYITGFNSGDYLFKSETGQFASKEQLTQTGIDLVNSVYNLSGYINQSFYQISNTSGFLNTLSGLSTGYVLDISGALQTQIGGPVNLSGYITTGQADLRYYSVNNPSGFITGVSTGGFLTRSESGQFYPVSNPQNYTNSGSLTATGSNLYVLITGLSGQSDANFYTRLNPSGYLASLSGLSLEYISGVSGALQNQIGEPVDLSGYITTGHADFRYYSINNPSGFITGISTGNFVTKGETGQFYPSSNPEAYSTSGDLFNSGANLYALITGGSGQANLDFYPRGNPSGFLSSLSGLSLSLITGLSGAFNIKIESTGSFLYAVFTGFSGQSNQNFYQNSNPSGFLTNLSGLSIEYITGISGALQAQIGGAVSLSGYLTTGQADLRYYPISNPSGFITGFDSGSYVTGQVARPTDLTNYYLNNNPSGFITGFNSGIYVTGQVARPSDLIEFYSSNNPSGFITSLSGVSVDLVNGLSGALNLKIHNTGAALYLGLTGLSGYVDVNFYQNSNPSGYLNTLSGLSVSYITGISGAIQTSSEPLRVVASQAEMEAGTESAIRSMSPLRVAQAIAALGGGGGSGSSPRVVGMEVDFGLIPVTQKTFTVIDAAIISTDKVIVSPNGGSATDRAPGDDEWDMLTYSASPATGTLFIYAHAIPGPVVGKRRLIYTVF